ncbi:MAG: NUDIX hydrolase [Pseudomonadota bacterium]
MGEFSGCKLALIYGSSVLVYQRDDLDHIPYPGHWDFPGGGREGNESPEACVLRELYEEFTLALPPSRLQYRRRVPSTIGSGNAFFFVATVARAELDSIVFGDEGQCWRLMAIDEFLGHPLAIPALVSRLETYLQSNSGEA